MLRDFARTVGQLPDPTFRRVLVWSLLAAIGVSILVLVLAGWLLSDVSWFSWRWLNETITALGVLGSAYVAWLMFPGIAIAVESLFLDRVVEAVERKHYPGLPPPRHQGWGEIALESLRLGAVVLAANLLLLPVYLVLLFVPPLNVLVYWLVNGVLMGREYFELVAARRLPPAEARALRRRHPGSVLVTGVAAAMLFSVPVVNLLAPLLASGAMVHLFERLNRRPAAPGGPAAAAARGTMRSMLPLFLLSLALLPLAGCQSRNPASGGSAAAGPPPAAPVAVLAPPPSPNALVGWDEPGVRSALGQPRLIRRDGQARVWQYASLGCVLDLYFYPEGGASRVDYVAMRRRDGTPAPAACFEEIRRENRGTEQRAGG